MKKGPNFINCTNPKKFFTMSGENRVQILELHVADAQEVTPILVQMENLQYIQRYMVSCK